MARKYLADFRKAARHEPFELELGDGEVVTFLNPNRISAASAFELARETDSEEQLKHLLSKEDYERFAEVLKELPVDELGAILDEALEHYGTSRGN